LWSEPFDPAQKARRPSALWFSRLFHPLPFLALLVLVGTSARRSLRRAQGVVIGVHVLYLLPYFAVSYYERYALPLVGVKVLLVLWAADWLLSCRMSPSCCRRANGRPLSAHLNCGVSKTRTLSYRSPIARVSRSMPGQRVTILVLGM
jgi:hypothetical protein